MVQNESGKDTRTNQTRENSRQNDWRQEKNGTFDRNMTTEVPDGQGKNVSILPQSRGGHSQVLE